MKNYTLPSLDLGDKRLNRRCHQLINKLLAKPDTSIPQVCLNWSDTKAAYRFLSNPAVSPVKIMAAHYRITLRNIRDYNGVILAPQDTTDLNYTSLTATSGLGYLETKYLQGLKVHACLGLTTEGTPLGLLHQQSWVRNLKDFGKRQFRHKKNLEDKESYRWLQTIQLVEEKIPKDKDVVVIGDREADIYQLFSMPRGKHIHLLVRANHNRKLKDKEKLLFEEIKTAIPAGRIKIELKRARLRRSREAVLTVRYKTVELADPQKSKRFVRVNCMIVSEDNPPNEVSGVCWKLITTLNINSLEEAKTVICWYSRRWLIERYFYCLKSGCGIEELQLKTRERLERALAVYSIVAYKLLHLTYVARENPDKPCSNLFKPEEWQILILMSGDKKRKIKYSVLSPPTNREAVRLIAGLGGFLGRKGDGEPGVKSIWCGLKAFANTLAILSKLKGYKKDVGNA